MHIYEYIYIYIYIWIIYILDIYIYVCMHRYIYMAFKIKKLKKTTFRLHNRIYYIYIYNIYIYVSIYIWYIYIYIWYVIRNSIYGSYNKHDTCGRLKFFSGSIEMRNCLDFIRIKLSSGVFKENHLWNSKKRSTTFFDTQYL